MLKHRKTGSIAIASLAALAASATVVPSASAATIGQLCKVQSAFGGSGIPFGAYTIPNGDYVRILGFPSAQEYSIRWSGVEGRTVRVNIVQKSCG